MWLMDIIPRNIHTKYELNMTKTKQLLGFQSGCHDNKIFIAIRNAADAHHSKEPL